MFQDQEQWPCKRTYYALMKAANDLFEEWLRENSGRAYMENHKKIPERLLNPKSFADYQLSITLPRAEAIALLNQIEEMKAVKAVVITGNAGVPDFYKEVVERTAEAAGRAKDWIFFDAVERWKKQGVGSTEDHFEPRQPCKICKHINIDENEYPCSECRHNPHI